MLHNVGFWLLADGIASFLDEEGEGAAVPTDAAAWNPTEFGLLNRGFDLYALHQGELNVGDCLLPRELFKLIGTICDSLVAEVGQQRIRQSDAAIALWMFTESINAAKQAAIELPAGGRGNLVALVQSANGICMVARKA